MQRGVQGQSQIFICVLVSNLSKYLINNQKKKVLNSFKPKMFTLTSREKRGGWKSCSRSLHAEESLCFNVLLHGVNKNSIFCLHDQTSSYLPNKEPHVTEHFWVNSGWNTGQQNKHVVLPKDEINAFWETMSANRTIIPQQEFKKSAVFWWTTDYVLLSPSKQSHTPPIRTLSTTLRHQLCPPEHNIHGVTYTPWCAQRDPYYAIRVSCLHSLFKSLK